MKNIQGIYQNKHMHWVGDGFPVNNLFSYDRFGQAISPFCYWTMPHLMSLNRRIHNEVSAHIRTVVSKQ